MESKPKLDIVFEMSGEDSGDIVMNEIIDGLSKGLNIKTESLEGDISCHTRLTIPLKDGRDLVIQSGDTDDHFIAIRTK